MNSPSIRVFLVDDHTLVREGIRALLDDCEGIEVVGQASDGQEALETIGACSPNVVLMDMAMPRLNGIDATERVLKAFPDIQVVVLSMHASHEYVRPALRAGARGYLVKGAGLADLELAVRSVAAGKAFVSPDAAAVLVNAEGDELRGAALSTREREVLQLVAEGHSSPKISGTLAISVKTVEGHRQRLMAKLGATNAATLVRHAIRLGLIDPEA
ncbi:MAG: two-component system response regulator NreC [Polyangiales bacterium]